MQLRVIITLDSEELKCGVGVISLGMMNFSYIRLLPQ